MLAGAVGDDWGSPLWWLVGLCGILGLLLGVALSRLLASAPYRLDDEADEPVRATSWWLVPAAGVLWAMVAWRFGDAGHGLVLPAYLVFGAVGLVLVATDLDVHRLPDVIVLPSFPVLVLLLALASWGTGEWGALGRALLAGLVCLVGFFVLALLSPGGTSLGLGDVKLAGLHGVALGWLGWWPVLIGVYAGFIAGGVVAAVLLVLRRRGMRSHIAYGPPLIVGAWLGVLLPVHVLTGALVG